MAGGKRPGGLTALAVLNFVFGGLGLIFMLGFFALLKAADTAVGEVTKGQESLGAGKIYIAIALGGLSAILLIVSGIGYIGIKKFLGRTLGNVYAIVSLGSTAYGIAVLKTGFGVGTIIGLIYPLLTLFLLNTTFKEDFVN